MKIYTNSITLFLIQEFKQLGKEKTLGSFTIEELDDLSKHIEEYLKASDTEEDEPPF